MEPGHQRAPRKPRTLVFLHKAGWRHPLHITKGRGSIRGDRAWHSSTEPAARTRPRGCLPNGARVFSAPLQMASWSLCNHRLLPPHAALLRTWDFAVDMGNGRALTCMWFTPHPRTCRSGFKEKPFCVCVWMANFSPLPPKSHGEFTRNDKMKPKWVTASSQPASPEYRSGILQN